MKTLRNFSIVHLSDLHFGRIEENALASLKAYLNSIEKIKLIIITGDLTQRAKKPEFKQAVEFLETLKYPVFLIPGNHDIPLYNLFLRIFSPYKKFLRYLGKFASTTYEDEDIAIYGIWSTNRFTVQSAKFNERMQHDMQKYFENSLNKIRIVATHHPIKDSFDINAHLVLSGHEHQSGVTQMGEYQIHVAAGTSSSNRLRKEVNSFNLIHFCDGKVEVETFHFAASEKEFKKQPHSEGNLFSFPLKEFSNDLHPSSQE